MLLDKNNEFYVGFTDNLRVRFEYHKDGKVFATKAKLPVELVYYETCISRYDATRRERYLKSGPGRKYLKIRLKDYLGKRPRAS